MIKKGRWIIFIALYFISVSLIVSLIFLKGKLNLTSFQYRVTLFILFYVFSFFIIFYFINFLKSKKKK